MADELFEVRNLFTLGNYQGAINAATKLKPSNSSIKTDRDVLLYRAYLAQRNVDLVLSETKGATDPNISAVRTLALYLSGGDNRTQALAEVTAMLSEGSAALESAAQVAAGTVMLWESRVDDALRALHTPVSLEAMGLLVQALLAAGRPDLAEAQVRAMQQADDDASATQLAMVWVHLAAGGERVNEAQTILQELSDKYGATATLLTGMAVCAMRMGRWTDAEKLLMDASERGAAREPETLVNLVVCATHTGKPADIVNRYITQLKAQSPEHPWLVKMKEFEAAFDAAAQKMAP